MLKHIIKLIWNKKRANALLFTEIFFCFIIVFLVSSFCIKSFRAYNSPYGYEPEGIWVILQNETEKMDSVQVLETRKLMKSELMQVNGVEAVAWTGYARPFSGSMWSQGGDENGFEFWTTLIAGDEDQQDVYGFNLVEGRWFLPEDTLNKYQPIVVNKLISDVYYDGAPLVDTIIKGINGGEKIVVGVVENLRYQDGFEEEIQVTVVYPEEHDGGISNISIRVAPGSGPELEEAISKRVAAVLKTEDFTIENLERARVSIARRTWIPIIIFLTIGGFLVINIAMGLFGVLFYTISRRRGEIGLRRSLGAYQSEITRQFTLEVYLVALAAMFLGFIFAIQVPALGLIDSTSFAYSNIYWGIFTSFVILSIVVLFCAYWPSRQGAAIHPAMALHEE
jgi:putative ABC transport system permease protein